MGRPPRRRKPSASNLISIFILVSVLAGVPLLVQQARAAGQALTGMVGSP